MKSRTYNLSQVAALLGLSEGTVQLWAEDGQLKGSKSSEGWTFLPRDVDAFVQARCHLRGFLRIRLDDSRFGDPWFLRRKRGEYGEPAAGSNGRPLEGVHFQEPLDPSPVQRPARNMQRELQRRMSKEIAKCRLSGLCSEDEMKLISVIADCAVAGWLSLRRMCVLLGCSHQTVANRIAGLEYRARFFWQAWRKMSRMRKAGMTWGSHERRLDVAADRVVPEP